MNKTQLALLKSACKKLTAPDPQFSNDEIAIFMGSNLGKSISNDPQINKGSAEELADIKQLIEKNGTTDLSNEDIAVILSYLSGDKILNEDNYLDLFHWFYFDRRDYRSSVPMQILSVDQDSLIQHHRDTLTKRKQGELWSKIINWD
mgnify:CR=1 FL=1